MGELSRHSSRCTPPMSHIPPCHSRHWCVCVLVDLCVCATTPTTPTPTLPISTYACELRPTYVEGAAQAQATEQVSGEIARTNDPPPARQNVQNTTLVPTRAGWTAILRFCRGKICLKVPPHHASETSFFARRPPMRHARGRDPGICIIIAR